MFLTTCRIVSYWRTAVLHAVTCYALLLTRTCCWKLNLDTTLRWPQNVADSQYEGKWKEFVFSEALNCQDLSSLVMDEWDTSNGHRWNGCESGKPLHLAKRIISQCLCVHTEYHAVFSICSTHVVLSGITHELFTFLREKFVKTWRRPSLQLQISGWTFTLPHLLYYRILKLFVNVHCNVCKLSVSCGFLLKHF